MRKHELRIRDIRSIKIERGNNRHTGVFSAGQSLSYPPIIDFHSSWSSQEKRKSTAVSPVGSVGPERNVAPPQGLELKLGPRSPEHQTDIGPGSDVQGRIVVVMIRSCRTRDCPSP